MNTALPIIVINLDRVPDRMEAIQAQFAQAELSHRVERFSASDATDASFSAPGYAPASWRDRWALLPSEQAIFTSHRNVWKNVARGAAAGAVICEDDIMISKDFPAALRSLKIADYGVIKMDGFSACRHYGPATQMGEFVVRDILDAVPSAACYTISKEAARRLLEDSNQFCATLDDFVFAARKGLRPVQLFPAVAVQGMCCADNQSVPASLATSERAADTHKSRADTGPFTYRFRKELRRTGKKLARTLGANRRLVRRGGVMCRPLLANDLPKYKS